MTVFLGEDHHETNHTSTYAEKTLERQEIVKKYAVPMIVATVVAVVVVVVLSGGGESSSAPRDPMTGKTEFDIPVQDPTLVAEGDVLYQANCAACHGSDLGGTAIGPSHLSVIYNPDHHGDGAFAAAVVTGVRAHHWEFGDMPVMPQITEADFNRIIAYIRENQRTRGFEAYPPR